MNLLHGGLVSRQTSSGGKVLLHNINKRGDTYLRTLLIHSAGNVLQNAKDPGLWLVQIFIGGEGDIQWMRAVGGTQDGLLNVIRCH